MFRHRRSSPPSPLKSPTPTICHGLGMVARRPADTALTPFINQRKVSPVVLLRHTRSALPSPLKSPTPATTNELLICRLVVPEPAPMLVPFIIQTVLVPVGPLRQTRSALPSPLKSPRTLLPSLFFNAKVVVSAPAVAVTL